MTKDDLLTSLTLGDFAQGQRAEVSIITIGTFAAGMRRLALPIINHKTDGGKR